MPINLEHVRFMRGYIETLSRAIPFGEDGTSILPVYGGVELDRKNVSRCYTGTCFPSMEVPNSLIGVKGQEIPFELSGLSFCKSLR